MYGGALLPVPTVVCGQVPVISPIRLISVGTGSTPNPPLAGGWGVMCQLMPSRRALHNAGLWPAIPGKLPGLGIADCGCLIFAGSEPLVNRSIIEWNPKLRTPKSPGNLHDGSMAWLGLW